MSEDGGDTFTILVHLRRADGKIVPYSLLIDATVARVRVRENEPRLLPAWCPELHINDAGYFCLGYGTDAPDPVTTPETAEKWWGIVISFLRLQERARSLKRWPNGNAWAHGGAARYQAIAEEIAVSLNTELWVAIRNGLLTVRKLGRGSLQVFVGAERVYAIWDNDEPRVVNLKSSCLCGSGIPLKKCGDHAALATNLALALVCMERATGAFWDFWKDRTCCGRNTTCPLQNKEAARAA